MKQAAYNFDMVPLDHVFQPIADLVADFVSCFKISHFLFRLTFFSLTVSMLQTVFITPEKGVIAILIFSYIMLVYLLGRDRLRVMVIERVLREGQMNPLRFQVFSRLLHFLLIAILVVSIHQDLRSYIYLSAHVFWTMALYFSACQRTPPATYQAA
jgi:hypothetical protein